MRLLSQGNGVIELYISGHFRDFKSSRFCPSIHVHGGRRFEYWYEKRGDHESQVEPNQERVYLFGKDEDEEQARNFRE